MEQKEKPLKKSESVVIGAIVAMVVGVINAYYMFSVAASENPYELSICFIVPFLWLILIILGGVCGLVVASLFHRYFPQTSPRVGAAVGGLIPCIICGILYGILIITD